MVIVSGATGFIGFYLVTTLHQSGVKVLAIDKGGDAEAAYFEKQGISFLKLDISIAGEFEKLPQKGVEAFVNLACVQPANVSADDDDPAKYVSTNILGITNVLNFCRSFGIKKVLHAISHRNVQGLWEKGETIFENSPRAIQFTGKYAMFSISESAAADIIEYFNQQHHMQGIIFRLPSVYGYGHHEYLYEGGKVRKTGLGVFINKARKGEAIEVWGDKDKGRDVVYVKDVVAAIVCALKSTGAKGLYNIASGIKLSLQQQVDAIIKIFSVPGNVPELIYKPDKANAIESCLYDIGKAKAELHWAPQYSFEDLLVDYKKEIESDKWSFLLERKKRMQEES